MYIIIGCERSDSALAEQLSGMKTATLPLWIFFFC